MSKLTPRLMHALRFVKSKKVFADIGSDHAYLAIEAINTGRALHAVASEVREGPLMRSKANTASYNGRIECVLSDGFDALRTYDIDCAAICGMGGETIADIISRAPDLSGVRLVLQPQSNQQVLRSYLWDHGFAITDESFVTEGIHAYSVICAEYIGQNERYSLSDTYLGKVRPATDDFRAYASRVGRYASNMQKAGFDPEIKKLTDECALICLKKCIVLASASPRRSDICRQLGLELNITPASSEADYDMSLPAEENMLRIAASKAREIAEKFPNDTVLGADTLVLSPDGEPLGKPTDADDAFRMLYKLSGSTHAVMTGVCICHRGEEKRFCVTSKVKFKELSADDINEYISTGEPFGKAGAYAIQGIGARLVDNISGSLTNIIGLPREETASALLGIFGK